MRMKTVSAFVTLYNHEDYIGLALASALRQTRLPDEIVVIDDASTDGSVDVVRRFKHPSIRLIVEPRNLGGVTTVKGLNACRGDYIAVLNSDDLWYPEKLERQLTWLEDNRGCAACFTWPTLIDENGKAWGIDEHPLQATFRIPNRSRTSWLRHFFFKGNAFCASSALIRRDCLDASGCFDSRFIQLQDFELWVRLAASGGDLKLFEEELTFYRVGRQNQNMSANAWESRSQYTFEFPKVLQNFWRISSVDEIYEIFYGCGLPEARDEALVKYYLALVASKQANFYHQQFAADSMFELGGDATAMQRAASLYGFSHSQRGKVIVENPLGVSVEKRLSRQARFLIASVVPGSAIERLRRFLGR